jgi:DNA-binding HxlR family transcriptional regulator
MIYLMLSDEKGHAHGDLARSLEGYNKGTISNKLNRMETRGYIKKENRPMPDRKQDYYLLYIKSILKYLNIS